VLVVRFARTGGGMMLRMMGGAPADPDADPDEAHHDMTRHDTTRHDTTRHDTADAHGVTESRDPAGPHRATAAPDPAGPSSPRSKSRSNMPRGLLHAMTRAFHIG
jgi:hypothetical protein